jgi:hypothetical protein
LKDKFKNKIILKESIEVKKNSNQKNNNHIWYENETIK